MENPNTTPSHVNPRAKPRRTRTRVFVAHLSDAEYLQLDEISWRSRCSKAAWVRAKIAAAYAGCLADAAVDAAGYAAESPASPP